MVIMGVVSNDIVHSVSVMILSKLGGIIHRHIFVTKHLLNLIIFYGLRRLLNNFIKNVFLNNFYLHSLVF